MVGQRLARVSAKLLGAAEKALDRLDWEEAHSLASDVLMLDPDNVEAATIRALAERHVGRRALPGRRQATALFADLVDSTPLAERFDVEVYNSVLHAYEQACRPAIEHHGGYLVAVKGDGIVACFGYPTVHEDDACRAVLAALDMLAALREAAPQQAAKHGIDLQARIGVDTGVVVIEHGRVHGAALNRAARLQGLAVPGTVLISATTNELVTDRFETAALGAKKLKGVDVPVEVFQVVGDARDRVRGTLAPGASGPFVGRQAELDRILRLWQDVVAGHQAGTDGGAQAQGAMVMVTGDPGIGKSRLALAALERTTSTGQAPIVLHCSPDTMTSTLAPVRRATERYLGIKPGDSDDAKLAKLESALAGLGVDRPDLIPCLGVVLDINTGDRDLRPQLAPLQLHECIMRELVALVGAVAARDPVTMVVEDLHWADPATLELLDRIVGAGVPAGLLILATARPGVDWSPAVTRLLSLRLDPLPASDARQLAVATAPGRISERDVDAIVARGDGVPLFVEQLAHALGNDRGPHADRATVPLTLTQLLQSRLDSVGTTKLVAQVAATIGRDFHKAVLEDILTGLVQNGAIDPQAAAVDDHLARLVDARLIELVDPTSGLLRFRHMLMRDAAYESQLLGDRGTRHAAAAEALVAANVQAAALIAFHFDRAGRPTDALTHYFEAVRRAKATGSFPEVMAHLARCQELLDEVEDPTARGLHELAVRLHRGLAVSSTAGYAAPGVMEDFGRARELCERLHDIPGVGTNLLKALFGVWMYYCAGGDFDTAASVSSAIERQLRHASLHAGRPGLDACRGVEAFYRGDLWQSLELLERAVAGIVADDADPEEWPLPHDPLAATCAFLGPVRFLTGDEAGALEAIRTGLARCDDLGFPTGPFSLAFVRTYEALLQRARGDAAAALAAAEEVARIGERHGFFDWLMVGRMHRAAAQIMVDTSVAALEDLGQGVDAWCTVGGEALIPNLLVEQAAGYLERDDVARAGACIDRALEMIGRGQRLALPEALRLRGEITARTDPSATASVEADLRDAIRLARAQGGAYFVLRAARTFRRLRGAEALNASDRAAVAEAVAAYPDHTTFADLAEARAFFGPGDARVNVG